MKQKLPNILSFISSAFLVVGILTFLIALFFEKQLGEETANVVYIIASVSEFISLTTLIIKASFFGFKPIVIRGDEVPQEYVKTVDVKPVKLSPEEELFKQYEDLYSEGLISKENLEKKREELLGK